MEMMTSLYGSPRTLLGYFSQSPVLFYNLTLLPQLKTMKQNKIIRFALLASAAMFAVGSAQGAVTAGSLVLFFQKPGDTDTVYVNLGNAATLYRGAAAGSSAANQALDIININSTLVSAFGSGWASDQNIYAGLAGVLENSTATTVVNGDQYRTLYVSRSRASVGTVGASGSTSYNLLAAGSLTSGSTNIRGLITNFATQLGSADQGIVTTDLSVIDNQNPTTLAGVQSTAFGQFTTGVQQRGSASTIGNFGWDDGSGYDLYASSVEFALDLQRLVPDGTVEPGEVAGQSRFGSYEGTVTIGSNGSVSFITIPEPSSITLAGIAGLALAFRRRRNA